MIDRRVLAVAGRRRFALQSAFDASVWLPAYLVAAYLRYDFAIGPVDLGAALALGAAAAALQVLVGRSVGLYVRRWRYGTLEEMLAVGRVVAGVGVAGVVANLVVLGHGLPVSATVVAPLFALGAHTAGRITWRLALETIRRPSRDHAEPLIVFGAGDGGHQAVRALLGSPRSPYLPVAALDDNPDLLGHRIKRDVTVVGDRTAMAEVARYTGATKLLVAIPTAGRELLRDLSVLADAAGLQILVLPPVDRLFDDSVSVADIRPLTEADLLGRRQIETDVHAVAGYLRGKRILVTGAGGSIGSELVRQINEFEPESVIMLDRDESALHAVQLSLEGHGLLDRDELVVACIRDAERLDEVFRTHRPHVVFHAAALKHLPLLQHHPGEGFKTNVVGTRNVLEMSGRYGVERVVNISTDKAAEPTSVLGRSKRIAERLTAAAAAEFDGVYLSVRFGNVIGSRGSVIPTFRAQVERGGPVTVTHPDVTRYFMTIPEACELVVQAGAIGRDGDVLVLAMGEPVRIVEVARRLIAASDRSIDLVYTGLRPGEKLHETLFGVDEDPTPTTHDMISRVTVPPLAFGALPSLDEFVEDFAPVMLDIREAGAGRDATIDLTDDRAGASQPPARPGPKNGHTNGHANGRGDGSRLVDVPADQLRR